MRRSLPFILHLESEKCSNQNSIISFPEAVGPQGIGNIIRRHLPIWGWMISGKELKKSYYKNDIFTCSPEPISVYPYIRYLSP